MTGARAIVIDPATMAGLRRGTIRAVRRIARSPLAGYRPGEMLLVREACVLARAGPGGREESAAPASATIAVFADGTRRHRDGRTMPGVPPTNPRLIWTPALRMPRWAARAVLTVQTVAIGPLQAIDREGFRAAGIRPVLGGLAWRDPGSGLWRDPARAFAAMWDRDHPTPGERWADDPAVVVLTVRLADAAPGSGDSGAGTD